MTDSNRYDTDLVSVLAHDLRTPINSVRGFIEVASFAGELNERQQQMLEKAMMALERMDTLINDVLDMSRVDSDVPLQREPCDLRLVITEAVSLMEGLAEKHSITVHVSLPDELPEIEAETHRIKQVMNNLVSNAIKYNREGGEVFVEAAHDKDSIVIRIRDTGFGIEPDDLPFVFDRFFRASLGKERRIHGTGLGLSIVKAIMERHNGSIEVESTVDVGTTFMVTFPL